MTGKRIPMPRPCLYVSFYFICPNIERHALTLSVPSRSERHGTSVHQYLPLPVKLNVPSQSERHGPSVPQYLPLHVEIGRAIAARVTWHLYSRIFSTSGPISNDKLFDGVFGSSCAL